MLNNLIRFSLENRFLVVSIAALLMVWGTYVAVQLPVDAFPDLERQTVTIMTEAGGLAPEEVETQVSFPIETAMNGLPGVVRVRSQSGIGLSIVYVEFDWGTDVYRNRQLVAEKLSEVRGQLPLFAQSFLAPISSIMGEIMLISVSSKSGQTPPGELRALADWTIRPRLLNIAGISQAIPIGGEVRQYQVLISPEKLRQYNLSIDDLSKALENANLNTTGGFIDSRSQEYLVRNIAYVHSIEDLKQTIVAYRNGKPILIGDVAEVKIGARVKRGEAGANGSPAVVISVQKQPGADTIQLTEKIDKAIQELKTTLPDDIEINTRLFRQANFIQASISNVIEALRDGAIIVAIVLFLFLLNFRTTFITLMAIPLSFVITFLVLKAFGATINTMTLGGLAIAIGELVDDAIVDIENIFRRLRENYASDNPKNPMRVIYEASLEVRSSIVYATFVVILVFLPLFMLQGIEGRLLVPLGFAYIIALAASLIVSLTVTPVLAFYLIPKYFQKKRGTSVDVEQIKQESFLVVWLKKIDEKILRWTLRNPYKVIIGSVILFIATVSTLPFLGSSFLPEFNEGTVAVNILANPGISLSESDRIGRIAEKLILQVPEVISTGRRTGRAELDEHAEGVHYTEIDIDLKKSERSREEILGDIRKALAVIPGVSVNIGQPISHRLDHMQSGVRAQIAIKLFGSDLSVLRAKADEIKNILMTVEGATDIQVEKQVLIPQIRFIVDRVQAANYGLTPGEIVKTLETGLNGLKVSEVIDGNRRTDIVLRFDERFKSQPENLKDILIHTPTGSQIPISTVAKIEMLPGPNQILRENGQRRIVISANTSGRDLGSVVQEIQQKIAAGVRLPEGYFLEFGGQFEAQQKATRILSLLSIISLFAIFALLVKGLGHWQAALQVMINVPLALIGAIWALHLSGGVFSVATLVGFVSLAGITSRNGIMMIAHYLHLMREEGEEFSEKMIIRGSLERLVPVMMTALTACLSLVPFAVAADAPGKEILHPLAVVVIGGILTATLLDQIVTPAVFYKFGRKIAEQVIADRENKIITE